MKVTLWLSEPLMPVTVMAYVPGLVDEDVETVSVEVAELPDATVTVDWLNVIEGPEGEDMSERVTFPEKPLRP